MTKTLSHRAPGKVSCMVNPDREQDYSHRPAWIIHGITSEEQASSVAANRSVPKRTYLFQLFQTFQSSQPPPLSSPAVAGEDEGGGLNGSNCLNVLTPIDRRLTPRTCAASRLFLVASTMRAHALLRYRMLAKPVDEEIA